MKQSAIKKPNVKTQTRLISAALMTVILTILPMLQNTRAAGAPETAFTALDRTSSPGAIQKGVSAAAIACTGPNFTPAPMPVAAGTQPASVAVGDFNNDGIPDLAMVNTGSNNVTIQLGNGMGAFTQPMGSPIGVGTSPLSVAVADFNFDGKLDLAVANSGSNNVTVLLGNGTGGFAQAAGSPIGGMSGPDSVAVGDFNLDGKPDLVVANFSSPNVAILIGNGMGGFTMGGTPSADINPTSVCVADFNLDGKADVAVTASSSNNVTIMLGKGTGANFTVPAGSPFTVGSQPFSVVSGDFNLDGKPDLAVANLGSDNVTILLGNGLGGFTQAAGSPVTVGDGPKSLVVGDFNLDGKPDIASANSNSADATILLGNGSGGFTQLVGSPVAAGASPQCIALGDFNLDGQPDLAIADQSSNSATILLDTCAPSQCGASFIEPAGSPISAGGGASSTAVGDFNFDGKLDLAVANADANNVTILLGNGTGGFTEAAGSPVAGGTRPDSVAIGDFNRDGKPDLVVASFVSFNVSILTGDGMGGFTPGGSPSAGNQPTSVCVADFNLDGKADVAVANSGSSNVTILLGLGTGANFTEPAGSPVGVGTQPYSVVSGDFNLDGKPDLAVANLSSDNVTILLGNGMGGFTQAAGSPISVGDGPISLAVQDFNRDGKPDLAAVNSNSNDVTILLGNGTGGFTQPVGSPFSVGLSPSSVAAGDFNLDGKADLVVANKNGNSLTVLSGNGSGGFTVGSPLGVGTSPASVVVGDFNRDGRSDLAAANSSSNNVSVRLKVGDTQPPTITCPGNISAKTVTPNDTCVAVSFAPTASDNCTVASVICSPASGSCFPIGTSTVTCTATDFGGNTAMCSFTVTVYNLCIQDDTNPSSVFQINVATGAYRFCCGGTTYVGVAQITKRGSVFTIQVNAGDRRVQASFDEAAFKGSASLQAPPGTTRCSIQDRDTRNNSCVCQ